MKHINILIRYCTIFGLGILMTAGCVLIHYDPGSAVPAPTSSDAAIQQPLAPTPKVVFFGSSTTVGVGATRGDRRWSTLVSKYLGWEEYNESLSGSSLSTAPRTDRSWPIPAAVERWRDAVLRRHPDRVVMLYGANDAYWNLPLGNTQPPQPATFRGDTEILFSQMQAAFHPDQLLVITPQPNQATQDRRAPYDAALEAAAQEIGAPFIDSVNETFPLADLADFSADGLHLNNLGHAAFASYIAGKIADMGIAATPPTATGGNSLPEAQNSLPGGFLRLDMDNPLSFGEIREISAHWVKSGQARLVVMRPDGRGGYDGVYRTPVFHVEPGTTQTAVPRWWVLAGDRLGVWADTDALGSVALASSQHIVVRRTEESAIADIRPTEGHVEPYSLALWISVR
jgi:lysophospholipase L1-like esterase